MKLVSACLLVLLAVASAKIYFQEEFNGDWESRWVRSDWKKSDGQSGVLKLSAGEWYGDEDADKGAMTSEDARFYAYSSKIPTPFSNEGKDFVLQVQVRHTQKIDCGGGYLKILPKGLDQKHFTGDSKYNIMFGPDICGTSTKKTHVIFTFDDKNLLTKKNIPAESDQLSHLYTLIVHPDDTYEVRIDGSKKESGKLSEDFDFLKPRTIKDPSAKKPADWVDNAKMDDPNDKKPANWDDIPKEIPDPEATKPDDWDDEADGEWEAPTIPNPEYKGEWKPKQIDNPAYKGPWVHPEIPNPDFVEHSNLYKYDDFSFVGIDVWQVKAGTIFDNIIITDSVSEAEAFADKTWKKNKDAEKRMFDDYENKKRQEEEKQRQKEEEERKKKEDAEKDSKDEEEEEESESKDDKEDSEEVGDKIKDKLKEEL